MTGSNPGKQVAVIGLGNMGHALAEALLVAGHKVTVWNRTAAKCDALVGKGAHAVGSAAEAMAVAEVAILCVTDHAATREIIHDPDVGRALCNKLLVQLSTISAEQSRETADWAETCGCTYLEGSIVGLPSDVTNGSATIVYAGPPDAFDGNREVLLALGGDFRFVGEAIGAAVTFDKVFFAYSYAVVQGFIQGAAMAHAKGFSVEAYTAMVTARWPSFLWKLERFGAMMARREYEDEEASLEIWAAAFAETLAMCRDLGVDDALPAAVMGNFNRAIDASYGQQDIPALFEVLTNQSASRPQQVSART